MTFETASYLDQVARWPESGKVILAQYDSHSVIVYQAYRPKTGHYAAEHDCFGHGFSYQRMSWIKPNFLWMMYRSGWGTKENQEVTLAIRLQREAFDEILARAVPSTYQARLYSTEKEWQQALKDSEVRLQWDPDHDPMGNKLQRRAIQLGLRGETLRRYGRDWILEIKDISKFVQQQRQFIQPALHRQLQTPKERPYPVTDRTTARLLGLTEASQP